MSWTILVSAEHASNAIPPTLENLGLTDEVLQTHVAWDPGTVEVSQAVAQHFSAPLFIGEWSRLVVDLNRSPTNETDVIPKNAFGVDVPGNQTLNEAARQDRLTRYHRPYWNAVQSKLQELHEGAPNRPLLHLSIHSFTDNLNGEHRPMSLGVMFDPARPSEDRFGRALAQRIESAGLVSAENGPYDGRMDAMVTACRPLFPEPAYLGIEIEINQRHLAQLDRIASVLIQSVESVIAQING